MRKLEYGDQQGPEVTRTETTRLREVGKRITKTERAGEVGLTPYFQDEHITLYVGDAREILGKLGKAIAQTSISSPPYFGLRDYGTAEWEGGDPECDHMAPLPGGTQSSGLGAWGSQSQEAIEAKVEKRRQQYKDVCGKCGATRIDQQLGLEPSPKEFVDNLTGSIYEGVRECLRSDGIAWVNLGDSYAAGTNSDRKETSTQGPKVPSSRSNRNQSVRRDSGDFKPKDLCLIPWRFAIAMQDAGWWVRQWFPWVKRSAMPGSQEDRATNALEVWYHFTKSKIYYYDHIAVRVDGKPESAARMLRGVGSGHKNINGAPGQPPHSMNKPRQNASRDRSNGNRNGEGGHLDKQPGGSRGFRNTDLWFESIKGNTRGLTGIGDDLVGVDCNPAGFSAEFCTACGRYYHDAKDKKEITRHKVGDKIVSECICGRTDSWLSHFATFPEKLIAPLIKCSTSERGQCSKCKAPWVRIVEPTEEYAKYLGSGYHDHENDDEAGYQQMRNENRQNKMRDESGNASAQYVTKGWEPTCKCEEADIEPQTVLEPFSGAGTTMIATARLGRRCIAIELNEDYARMSVERYKREMKAPVDPPRREELHPLFANIGNAEAVAI